MVAKFDIFNYSNGYEVSLKRENTSDQMKINYFKKRANQSREDPEGGF